MKIDSSNNILAVQEGNSTITATFDGVSDKIELKIQKNPVNRLDLISGVSNVKTGDVIQFKTNAFDKKGNIA